MATSNDTRVRKEGFSNSSASVWPASTGPLPSRLIARAASSTRASSSADRSSIEVKSRPCSVGVLTTCRGYREISIGSYAAPGIRILSLRDCAGGAMRLSTQGWWNIALGVSAASALIVMAARGGEDYGIEIERREAAAGIDELRVDVAGAVARPGVV